MTRINGINQPPSTGAHADPPAQQQGRTAPQQPAANAAVPRQPARAGAGRFAQYLQGDGRTGPGLLQKPLPPLLTRLNSPGFGGMPVPFANHFHPQGMGTAPAGFQPNAGPGPGWNNQVYSRPYIPVQPKQYANYGTQQPPSVTSTDYALQAAQRLIGPDGRLDRAQIPHLLQQLRSDTSLSAHHRNHMIKTLERMRHDHQLAATIDSICERPDKPLRGPAADLVRATLNLPPAHTHLSKADARTAAVMTLLGNLRQGSSGSCFATGPAICLHEDDPATVAGNLKEMLEENKITFRSNGSLIEVPLNRRASRAEAQVPLNIGPDGTCYGNASGGAPGVPYKLHQSPGMQGALTALGIPEHQMESAVIGALWEMGGRQNRMHRLSSQQIIEYLAHHPPPNSFPGNTRPNQRIASALNVFAGKEDVRLLRAWEYTVATHGESRNNNEAVQNISYAALYGNPVPGRPDLKSLATRTGEFQQALAANPYFHGIEVATISQQLFNDVQSLMKQRFFLQYDADLANKGISADGVSNRGGFVLYDRVPANDPSKWQRIDNPAMFQAAMAHLVDEASGNTQGRMQSFDGKAPQALRAIADNLKQHIGGNPFVEHAATSFNMAGGNPAMMDPYNLPWSQARGSFGESILEHYGGSTVHSEAFTGTTTPQPRGHAAPGLPGGSGDATHIVKFLCDGMAKMVPLMHEKARSTGGNFKVPIGNSPHVFTFMPMNMSETWLHGRATSEQWIEHALKQPALRHMRDTRTEPPLANLLQSLGAKIGATPQEMQYMQQQVSLGLQRNGRQAYSLERIHHELKAFARSRPNPGQVLAGAEDALMNAAPAPARIFADTNWPDGKGEPVFVGALYNPLKGRVEAQFMNEAGGDRQPVGEQWLSGRWNMSTPLGSARTAPAA